MTDAALLQALSAGAARKARIALSHPRRPMTPSEWLATAPAGSTVPVEWVREHCVIKPPVTVPGTERLAEYERYMAVLREVVTRDL